MKSFSFFWAGLLVIYSSSISLLFADCDPLGYIVTAPSGIGQNTIVPFNSNTNVPSTPITYPGTGFDTLLFPPNSTKGYITANSDVYIMDSATGIQTGVISVDPGQDLTGIVASSDGSRLFVVDRNPANPSIAILSTITNTTLGFFSLPISASPLDIAITPDGTKLYVTSNTEDTVYILAVNPTSLSLIGSIILPTGSGAEGIAISQDGSMAYVASPSAMAIYPIQLATNTLLPLITVPIIPLNVTTAPDGSVFTSGLFGLVKIQSNMVVGMVSVPSPLNSVTMSADNTKVYCTIGSGALPNIYIFDALSAMPNIVSTFSIPAGNVTPVGVAFVPCSLLTVPGFFPNCSSDIWQSELFIAISWIASSTFTATEYLIYRDGELVGTSPAFKTSFVDHNLSPNQTYDYTIIAQTSTGGSITIGKGSVTL